MNSCNVLHCTYISDANHHMTPKKLINVGLTSTALWPQISCLAQNMQFRGEKTTRGVGANFRPIRPLGDSNIPIHLIVYGRDRRHTQRNQD